MPLVLIIILSICLIRFVRKRTRPFSPASIFTIFWAAQILFIVIGWSNYLFFNYTGILYILLGVFCFDVGYLSVLHPVFCSNSSMVPVAKVVYNKKRTIHIYFIVLFLAFIGVFYGVHSHGFSISSMFDLASFMEMSNANSLERYADVDQDGIIDKIFGINACACPILGGMSFCIFDKRKKIWSFAALLPQAISGLSQGAKMGIITGAFLWLIGLIVAAQLLEKKIVVKFKTVLLILASIIGFIALLTIVMMFRIGQFDVDTMYVVFGKAISYGLGHLPAFDMWFSTHEDVLSELTGGGQNLLWNY